MMLFKDAESPVTELILTAKDSTNSKSRLLKYRYNPGVNTWNQINTFMSSVYSSLMLPLCEFMLYTVTVFSACPSSYLPSSVWYVAVVAVLQCVDRLPVTTNAWHVLYMDVWSIVQNLNYPGFSNIIEASFTQHLRVLCVLAVDPCCCHQDGIIWRGRSSACSFPNHAHHQGQERPHQPQTVADDGDR